MSKEMLNALDALEAEKGISKEVINNPKHKYTKILIDACIT